MRFLEFAPDQMIDRYIVVFKNLIGRASAKKVPLKMKWAALNQILKTSSANLLADYETFASVYDQSPAIQNLVKNFNAKEIEFKVPGAPDADDKTQDGSDSQAEVDKIAASAAPQQLAQQ